MSRFNIDEFLKIWFLSALVYRIKNESEADDFVALVKQHLGMVCHIAIFDDGAQVCGLAHDPCVRSTVYKFERGTGGFDFWSRLMSWGTDLNVGDDQGDGKWDGFQRYANRAFDAFKGYLENAQTVICGGHSQGSAVAAIIAWLLCRLRKDGRLNGFKNARYYLFAAPPAGEKEFADEMAAFEREELCGGWRFVLPGDPIDTDRIRKGMFVHGADVGQEVILLDAILKPYREKIGPANAVNHSPRLQTLAMFPMLIHAGATMEQLEMLELIFSLCDQ